MAIGFGYTLRLRAAQIIELYEYTASDNASADSMGFGKVDGGFVSESFEFEETMKARKSSRKSSVLGRSSEKHPLLKSEGGFRIRDAKD